METGTLMVPQVIRGNTGLGVGSLPLVGSQTARIRAATSGRNGASSLLSSPQARTSNPRDTSSSFPASTSPSFSALAKRQGSASST